MNWADYLKGWLSLSFFRVQSDDYQELLGSYWQQVNFPHSCSIAFVCLFVCFLPNSIFLSFSLQDLILDEDGTSAVIICALDECSIGFWMDQLVQLVFLTSGQATKLSLSETKHYYLIILFISFGIFYFGY